MVLMLKETEVKIVDMKEVVRLLKIRQGDHTPEAFASIIDIPANTLRAYCSGRRKIGEVNAGVLIRRFRELADFEMADAIGTYFQQKIGV